NGFLLVLGTAYLAVGAIDLLHTLAYEGMGVFRGFESDLATRLWIAARYVQSISIVLACQALKYRVRSGTVAIGYAAVAGLLLWLIFTDRFPHCYLEGQGLTPFKIISEYVICLVFVAGIVCLLTKKPLLDAGVRRYVIASLLVTIASELAFTRYISVYGLANLLGHLLKLVAFYLMYKGIIEGGVRRPYSVLFRNLTRSEEELRRQRDFVSNILNTARALIVALDSEGRVVDLNPACEELTGYTAEEAAGQYYWDLFVAPEEREDRQRLVAEVRAGRELADFESVWVTRDGRRRTLTWSVAVSRDEHGEAHHAIACGIDITERKRAERDLRQLLDEKDLLLDELHHRVKNNLQIIAGLLDLSRRQAASGEARRVIGDAHTKVHAMALIHEETYRAIRLDQIDLGWYLRRLTRYLAEAYGPEDGHIRVAVDASETHLPLTQAVPCGLLINELVINAFQHAFAGRDRGEILVRVTTGEDGQVTVVVRDDGVGIVIPSSDDHGRTLGLQLVRGLASQLHGTIEFSTNGGTEVTVRFQREQPSPPIPPTDTAEED
ncbi:MAG: PAS domain S-box protein, partial [Armatimonadetes bacterium]|nr:PAS domain S-box protein [Armatimonadota bacterium]